MTHEAAGVPTTRNDEDRQDNDRQENDRQDASRPAPEVREAPEAEAAAEAQEATAARDAHGAPDAAGAADAAAGEPVGPADAEPRPEARLARAVQVAEQALIEFEIAVETFRVEVENFSRLHHQKLGPMYARLDELDALIAEARAARTGDPEDERKAREARAVVMPMPGVDELFHDWMDTDGLSPEAAAMLTEQPVRPPKRVRPSEEARRLYRELARKAHPDLAQDEAERQRRDEFIARVNAAYGRGDVELLKELVAEWAAGPVQQPAPLSESEELYARLEWLSRRKELLTVLATELEEGAIGSMLRMAPDDPDQLLEDIAEQLLGEVSRREAELAEMVQ
ncbi:J domain-containing protein [Streptomyces sp. NPDC058576]|uniref:J domain-containing protein n=1 Tax=Streptomyces sp. NPDC058576 TaxID=3346547 RepID=UPI00366112EF